MSIRQPSSHKTVFNFLKQHHLNCLNCQRSIVIDDCPISGKLDRWFQSQEFKVYYHTLEFFGLCTDCQEQEAFLKSSSARSTKI